MKMSSQVPEGYKRTEVGVIPEDWNTYTLEAICKLSSGTTPSRSQESRYYGNGKYNWVKTTDLNNSQITSTEEQVTQEALDETCLQLYPPGTVFVAMYGGFNQIGRTGILEISAAVNQALIAIQPKEEKLSSAYLLSNLNYRVEYWKTVASSSRKDPNITSKDVRNFVIPLPDKDEQEAIAFTLSDIDNLLASLDRLIAKKRDLKQATMQQLLTGKKRLPGFVREEEYQQTEFGLIPKDWEIHPLSQVVDFLDEKRRPVKESERAAMRGSYPYYGASGIVDYVNDYLFDDELILLAEDGENILSRSTRLVISVSGKIWVNNHAHVLKPGSGFDLRFLSEYLESLDYSMYNSGTAQPKLNQKTCRDIPVIAPQEEEQAAIAQVLTDMDTELTTLQTRRAKTQALKQAMMQELLTGRTRLV